MDFRYLKAFIETARHGSISGAALQMRVAQSAISRQIALLEDSLQEALFLRGARGVRLTPKGEELFKKISSLEEWMENEYLKDSQPIRLGALEGVLNQWLGPRLAKAKTADLPKKLFIKQMSNQEIEESLEKGELEIGLSSLNIESEWVTSRKIYSEKICLVSREKISKDKLENYNWIGVKKTNYLQQLSKNKFPERIIQAGSVELLLLFVKEGLGIAALPESMAAKKGLVVSPTSLSSESIYLNLPVYQKLPTEMSVFITKFITD